ncbi:hypothetical protein MHH37_09870 [Solibacillus sp. FSL K6-1781]
MKNELQQSIAPLENMLILEDNFDDDPETCFIQFIINIENDNLK